MPVRIRLLGLALLLAAGFGLISSCSSDDPAETASLSAAQLAHMVLAESDLDPDLLTGLGLSHAGLVTNLDDVSTSAAREGEIELLHLTEGRRSGYQRYFTAAETSTFDFTTLGSRVDEFANVDGAGHAFTRMLNDPFSSHPLLWRDGARLRDRREFAVPELGEAWYGEVFSVSAEAEDRTLTVWTRVLFRRENVIASVLLISSAQSESSDLAIRLALAMEARVARALAGQVDPDYEAGGREVLLRAIEEIEALTSVHFEHAVLAREGRESQPFSALLDAEVPGRVGGVLESEDEALSFYGDGAAVYVSRYQPAGESMPERTPRWRCIEDIQAFPALLYVILPDLGAVSALKEVADLAELEPPVPLGDSQAHRVRIRMAAHEYLNGPARFLGPNFLALGLQTIDGVEGEANLELYIGVDDFRLHRYILDLDYEVFDLAQQEVEAALRIDGTITEFNAGARLPSVGSLPDCSFREPPCFGRNLSACLNPVAELVEPKVSEGGCGQSGPRVCLVPIGAASPDLVFKLQDYYENHYGMKVGVLPGLEISETEIDTARQQFAVSSFASLIHSRYRPYLEDPDVTVIGITPLDMFLDSRPEWRFAFFAFSEPGRSPWKLGVASYFRMLPLRDELFGDEELLQDRVSRAVNQIVGVLHFEMERSSDPRSPLFDSVLNLTDLDLTGEHLIVED